MKTGFFYAYILQSESDPPHFYTGFTENLESRLAHHNSGGDPHTTKYRPWLIKTAVAFADRKRTHNLHYKPCFRKVGRPDSFES